ncbi:MAG: hypothetical protein HY986_01015 [Candidatus Melainabacteria bacterium]|nr:hypothetical protein [Candidatus Melainabacteria bacterium]
MFDATKRQFTDISFEQINIDEPSGQELAGRYGVTGIPRLVFLDGSSQVLYNGGAPMDAESFHGLINQHR